MQLKITEIFSSIQGESSWAGYPFFFIRLTGCNLRCNYCDTKYAYNNGNFYKIVEIIDLVKKSGIEKVLITGGEPLIQENVYLLIDELINNHFKVFIETNGSILIDKINRSAIKIVDFKTPSSGECMKNNFENINFLTYNDEVKFVISDYNDFVWSKEIIFKFKIFERVKNILFSPVKSLLNPKDLAEWILQEKLNFVRLQLQLHKIISVR